MISNKEKAIKIIENLPALSSGLTDLLLIMAKGNHSARDLAVVLERDPILAAKILKVSNSAAFARRVPAETVLAAISYLGDVNILSIAMKLGDASLYSTPLAGYETLRGALWEHSLKAALAAKILSEKCMYPVNSGVAYTGALLHDIGKIVLSLIFETDIKEKVLKIQNDLGKDFLAFERSETGMTHCDAGELLAQAWKLPMSLHKCISFHHFPAQAEPEYRPLLYVVHVADWVAMLSGASTGNDSMAYSLDEDYTQYLNITRKDLFVIINQVMIEFEKIQDALKSY